MKECGEIMEWQLTGESRITRMMSCPSAWAWLTINTAWTVLGSELGLYFDKPQHNRVSFGTASWYAFCAFLYDDIFSLNLLNKYKPEADVSHSVPVPADCFDHFCLVANVIFLSVPLFIYFFFLSRVFSSLDFINFSVNFLFQFKRYSFDNE